MQIDRRQMACGMEEGLMYTADDYRQILEEIWDDLDRKNNCACPVCSTYIHKHWCWYPRLCQVLGKPLDDYDTEHIERTKRFREDEQMHEGIKSKGH